VKNKKNCNNKIIKNKQNNKYKKISLVAQKIGQNFRNAIKKNQLYISNGSGVINFLMKPCNLAFLRKK
jgi:hypothetical protein